MNNRWWVRFAASMAIIASLCFPLAANAGRNCEETLPDAAKTRKAIRLSKQVRDTLELSGANLVLVGRIGSDQSERGVRYTHVAYLLRDHPAGAWTVVHELNACGSGSSDLFDEGLANFYMDDLFEYETRIVIPSQGLQEKLIRTLQSPLKRAFHEPTYSSIAFPWSTRYQNSNGWVMEILASAAAGPDEVRNREQAQRWLRENGYRPGKVHIGGGERAGARLFTPNIRFGDHPESAWQAQTYEVNTGDAALEFMRRFDPESRLITQRLDAKPVVTARPAAIASAPVAEKAAVKAEAVSPVLVSAPAIQAAPAANTAPPASRAQLLQSMQGLIVTYACRPQGYLSQCRQLERAPCEKLVSDSVLRCFATVSDQQLMNGTEQMAMQQVQEIGYCAVEGVDAGYAAGSNPARTPQGASCPSVRNYR